jgi:hypothetical protein
MEHLGCIYYCKLLLSSINYSKVITNCIRFLVLYGGTSPTSESWIPCLWWEICHLAAETSICWTLSFVPFGRGMGGFYIGTLLNGSSRITRKTANALRAAMKMGVQVIIATGKVCNLCLWPTKMWSSCNCCNVHVWSFDVLIIILSNSGSINSCLFK